MNIGGSEREEGKDLRGKKGFKGCEDVKYT